MEIIPLFSSSSGNAVYIRSEKGGVLVDAGVSYKRLSLALKARDIDISRIFAVFITHEHSDHIQGLRVLTKNNKIPVYARERTLSVLMQKGAIFDGTELIPVSKEMNVGDISATYFNTPHDAVSSCGYKFISDNDSCAVCTDLGYITKTVDSALYGCATVMIESNYDEEMLYNGPYPYDLKDRIFSNKGHLSNIDSANQVRKLVIGGTKSIILGHLSQQNNTPEVAERETIAALSDMRRNFDYTLKVAPVGITP